PSAISAWVRVLCLGQQEQRLAARSPAPNRVRNRLRLGFGFMSSILEVSWLAVVAYENHPVRFLYKTGSFVLQRKGIPNAFVNFYKSNYFNAANERRKHKKMSQ
ncbi:MAG: hypothetical protein EGP78_01125, partial [Alistipes shahii]|nr:hypothetical protein [Alistipes shahii]